MCALGDCWFGGPTLVADTYLHAPTHAPHAPTHAPPKVTQPLLRQAYDAYSFAVIPRLGQLVAGDAESYQYLVESIRQFPDQVGRACVCAFACV